MFFLLNSQNIDHVPNTKERNCLCIQDFYKTPINIKFNFEFPWKVNPISFLKREAFDTSSTCIKLVLSNLKNYALGQQNLKIMI